MSGCGFAPAPARDRKYLCPASAEMIPAHFVSSAQRQGRTLFCLKYPPGFCHSPAERSRNTSSVAALFSARVRQTPRIPHRGLCVIQMIQPPAAPFGQHPIEQELPELKSKRPVPNPDGQPRRYQFEFPGRDEFLHRAVRQLHHPGIVSGKAPQLPGNQIPALHKRKRGQHQFGGSGIMNIPIAVRVNPSRFREIKSGGQHRIIKWWIHQNMAEPVIMSPEQTHAQCAECTQGLAPAGD